MALDTDTLYGIACDASSDEGVRKLYDIKARDGAKPIGISVGSCDEMAKVVELDGEQNESEINRRLVEKLLPGPFTGENKRLESRKLSIVLNSWFHICFMFILPVKSDKLSKLLNKNAKNVGVRIPDNQFIIDLANLAKVPLALTSANLLHNLRIFKISWR